ncbi:MAG: hypothetical protein WBB07_23955 [Mycobacterium sp.]
MKYSKTAALIVLSFTIGYALFALVGGNVTGSLVAACIATVAALAWLVLSVQEQQARILDALPTPAEEMTPDWFEGTPYAAYRDGILPTVTTETVHSPARAAETVDGGRKPHWDTDTWGAPE